MKTSKKIIIYIVIAFLVFGIGTFSFLTVNLLKANNSKVSNNNKYNDIVNNDKEGNSSEPGKKEDNTTTTPGGGKENEQKPTGTGGYTANDYRTLINKIAFAFYNRGIYVQYSNRKMMHAYPENATAGHTVYTSCTSFANQIYYDAFGINLPLHGNALNEFAEEVWNNKSINNYNENTKFGKYVLKYYSKTDIEGKTKEDVIREVACNLQKGDIYNFHENGMDFSHTMIVIGVEGCDNSSELPKVRLMEANGNDYDFNNKMDKYENHNNGKVGAVNIVYITDRMNLSNLDSLTFVRYITDDFTYLYKFSDKIMTGKLSLTNMGVGRLQNQDIYIDKNSSVLSNSYVPSSKSGSNETSDIVFRITIKRASPVDYKNIVVKEQIQGDAFIRHAKCLSGCENVTTYEGVVSSNKKEVEWNFSIAKDAPDTVILGYTVQVNENAKGDIISTGTVSGIKNAIYIYHVGKVLSKDEQNSIVDKYNQVKNNGYSSTTDFVRTIYNGSDSKIKINVDYLKNLDVRNVLKVSDTKYNYNINMPRNDAKTEITDNTISKVILSNFYGLRITNYTGRDKEKDDERGKINHNNGLIFEGIAWDQLTEVEDEFNERAREIKLDHLQVGDILYKCTDTDDKGNHRNKLYLYLGNNLTCDTGKCKGFVTVENGKFVEVKGTDAVVLLRNIIYDNYMILSPSLNR